MHYRQQRLEVFESKIVQTLLIIERCNVAPGREGEKENEISDCVLHHPTGFLLRKSLFCSINLKSSARRLVEEISARIEVVGTCNNVGGSIKGKQQRRGTME